jgi:glycosyltransferase involved in cell wall biosynthesis
MIEILLLRGVQRAQMNSMDRYSSSLIDALRDCSPLNWAFDDLTIKSANVFNILNKERELLKKIDEYISRFVLYPLKSISFKVNIYHVIDHDYSFLRYALRNRPLVVTCHDLIILKGANNLIPGFYPSKKTLLKFKFIVNGLREADKIITVSNCTKNDIIHYLHIPREKIHVIHNGIDPNFKILENKKDIRKFRESLRIPNDRKIIIHISAEQVYKNIEGVLHVTNRLIHNFNEKVSLLRVGDLLTENHRDLVRKLDIEENVYEAGYLSDSELVLAYNAADVLIFPSWYEGFGFPPLEAMACGTPVVASNRSSLPEIIGDAGVLISPDDYEGMARAIHRIFSDEQWRLSLVEKGLKQIVKFKWRNAAAETLSVYEEVILQRGIN